MSGFILKRGWSIDFRQIERVTNSNLFPDLAPWLDERKFIRNSYFVLTQSILLISEVTIMNRVTFMTCVLLKLLRYNKINKIKINKHNNIRWQSWTWWHVCFWSYSSSQHMPSLKMYQSTEPANCTIQLCS